MNGCIAMNGTCYNRSPEHRREAHPSETFTEHRVEQWDDGTWLVREYVVNVSGGLDQAGNARGFPNRAEAQVYADSRNTGFLDAGALLAVHEWRLAQSRADSRMDRETALATIEQVKRWKAEHGPCLTYRADDALCTILYGGKS